MRVLFPSHDLSKRMEDPKNLQIGGDSPLPTIPTSSRYKTRTGATTPALLSKVFINFLGGEKVGLDKRIKKISKISAAIAGEEDAEKEDSISTALSNAIVINYLRDVVQNYESSASGFLFENFLALLLSGTKEGGNLKIEDFTFRSGSTHGHRGSAKLYRSDAKDFGGSLKLFYNLCKVATTSNKEYSQITYVIGIKGMDLDKLAIYTILYRVSKLENLAPTDSPPRS